MKTQFSSASLLFFGLSSLVGCDSILAISILWEWSLMFACENLFRETYTLLKIVILKRSFQRKIPPVD